MLPSHVLPSRTRVASLSILLCAAALPAFAQQTSLFTETAHGSLEYHPYANHGTDEDTVNILPDFSWAGYKFSEVPIPDVPAAVTLEPQEGDDRIRIQQAIDQIGQLEPDANGFRGALFLKAGYYEVNGALVIRHSGIVIRGEKQASAEEGGTQIHASRARSYDLFNFFGPDEPSGAKSSRRVRILRDVPTGTRDLVVADPTGFAAGDLIHVLRTPNDAWIDDIGMREYGWTPGSYNIFYERTITAVTGDTITVDVPMVQALTEKYGLGEIYHYDASYRLRNVGIEDLYLTSRYASETDENHANRAIYFQNVEDAWARRVTAKYFQRGTVTINWGYRITVEDCALVDPKSLISGSRRYSFEINKGSFNLFQRIYTRNGRHDQVTGSRVAGPNVYVDNYSEESHAEAGPHHRYATGLLMDNVRNRNIRVRNRGFTSSGSGHGWSGAQVMFWNVEAETGYEVYVSQPAGSRSWAIGSVGRRTGNGLFELNDQNAQPRSLFYRQLQDRIGKEAVDAMTSDAQKDGTILEQLRDWKGDGPFDPARTTSVDQPGSEPESPSQFFLSANYPNPFNPATRIRFGLGATSMATLSVHNMLGRQVAQPLRNILPAGVHEIPFAAGHLPSGVYFYTLTAGAFTETRSMVLLK